MNKTIQIKLFWVLVAILLLVISTVFILHSLSEEVVYHTDILQDGTLILRKIDNFKGDTLEIPDVIGDLPITSISNMALLASDFDYEAVKRLILPNGIRTLYDDTFSKLTRLEEVSIGSALEEFNPKAFRGVNYVSVQIDEDNIWLDTLEGCLVKNTGDRLELCYGDHIPNGVAIVGDHALAYRSFETITIPESVIYINKRAFMQCNNLTTINIPGNVRYILEYAFTDCENLESVTLQDGVISIGEGVFSSCDKLSSVSLPDSLRTVGDWSFSTTSLTDVPYMGSVTKLPACIFRGCDNMIFVHIPEGIQIIDEFAFSNCENMQSITFPSTLRIFESADIIAGCNTLSELTVTENNLNYYSSSNCLVDRQTLSVVAALSNAVIPSGVKVIGEMAFSERHDLTCISVPDGVEKLEYSAFAYCYDLKSLYIPLSATEVEKRIIGENADDMHIYCEAESQPDGWDENWNNAGYPVTWGVSREQFKELIK